MTMTSSSLILKSIIFSNHFAQVFQKKGQAFTVSKKKVSLLWKEDQVYYSSILILLRQKCDELCYTEQCEWLRI